MFDFSKDYFLENEFVHLRPLTTTDANVLSEVAKDTEIWRYLFERGTTKEQLVNYIAAAIELRNHQLAYPFAVIDKQKNKLAGTTRLYDLHENFKVTKLGHTWYGKEFRGTYLNKHTKFLLFQFIFDTLGLERVGFGVHSQNSRSINALISVGCNIEGKLESFMPAIDGKTRADIILLRLLKNEWQTTVKTNLRAKLT